MSNGSLSAPAIKALSLGAKKAGCWINTGEAGLSSFHLEGGADLIFQIGTAKYGGRDEDGHISDEKLIKSIRYGAPYSPSNRQACGL
jgi:glutamate synthase domain-containing protein 2